MNANKNRCTSNIAMHVGFIYADSMGFSIDRGI